MKLLIDTRQKKDRHSNKNDYFKKMNITTEDRVLEVGDYMFEGGTVSVDTKQNIYELVNNLFGKNDKIRFQKECKRAKKMGIKLYILIEQKFDKEKLLKWKSIKKVDGESITKVTGPQIYARMELYCLTFGVSWRFCDRRSTGKTILKLLTEDKCG